MAKVRVGIIGTGGMAQGHIKRLAQNPEAEVAAFCDIKEAALKRTVENHPTLKDVPQFDDFRDMIANVKLDAIHIDTPHTIHYEQIMYGLDKGLHVLTEKPMVCTVEHAHHVVNKVKETGKVLVLAYQRHYQPEFLYIRDEIASGKYGAVQFVQGLQCQNWLEGCRGAWRHDPAHSGGGQLNDSGSHLLGVLLFTTGLTVDSVAGFIDNFDVPVDINSALSLRFVGGAQGNISVVGNAPTWHEDITIWCAHGIFFMRNGALEVCGPDRKRFTPTAEEMPKGSTPDDNFINAIQGKEPVGSPATWGLRVIELTEAAWKSAASHQITDVAHLKK
jgi:predicted dehydrogenase